MKQTWYFFMKKKGKASKIIATQSCIKPKRTKNYKYLQWLLGKNLCESVGYTIDKADI